MPISYWHEMASDPRRWGEYTDKEIRDRDKQLINDSIPVFDRGEFGCLDDDEFSLDFNE